MHIKSFCSIEDLNYSNHFIKKPNLLPASFLKRKLVLENPEPFRDGEYFMFYDKKHKRLYLRYLAFDNSIDFDFWKNVNIGELIGCEETCFQSKLAKLKESNQLYFHVVNPKAHYTRFYVIEPSEDNEQQFGEQIKMIFVPSKDFIKGCVDSNDVFQSLKTYFCQFTDYMNGEHFMIRTDTYDLNAKTELVTASNSDWSGSVIGYECAMNMLREFELPTRQENS